MDFGGLTTVMLNYYQKIDNENLIIDFASTNIPAETDKSFIYIKENGAKYFSLGSRKKKTVSYLMKLYRVIKDNKYDVVHINGNSATMCLDLFVARIAGCGIRISHGHTTRSNHPLAA